MHVALSQYCPRGQRPAQRCAVVIGPSARPAPGRGAGLRSYVDLKTGVIRAWFQVQRAAWRHGCDDPNAYGALWHRAPCPRTCRQHRHEPNCPKDCRKREHRCPEEHVRPQDVRRPCPALPFPTRRWRRVPGAEGQEEGDLAVPARATAAPGRPSGGPRAGADAADDKWNDHDLVFATPTDNPIDRSDDWREWKAVLRAAGVRNGRLHDARHTAGTLLIEQGVRIRGPGDPWPRPRQHDGEVPPRRLASSYRCQPAEGIRALGRMTKTHLKANTGFGLPRKQDRSARSYGVQ
jgi:hypothetical protein